MSDIQVEVIPQSTEAEQALIGAVLYDNEVYNRISHIVKPNDFYNPIHHKIYDAISLLIEKGGVVDAIVLKNRFSKDETLKDIGGVEYIARLLHESPSGMAAVEYAKLIRDLSFRRGAIRIADEIKKDSIDLELDKSGPEIIEDAESNLFLLAEKNSGHSGPRTTEKIIIDYIDHAAAAFSRDGGLSGLSTGLKCLDDKLSGLHKSDLIIIAGRPSMGKSALAAQIGYTVAKNHREERQVDGEFKTTAGGRVLLFSLEMSDVQLMGRLIAMDSRVPSFAVRKGDISTNQFEQIRDAADEAASVPLRIDDTGGLSIGALSTRARRMKRTVGLDLIIVDYLQLLSAGKYMKSTDGRVQEITHITMGLKALAKDLDVPVIALAQLSRQVEQRDDKRPQLSDLRESGSIEQDADVVMFVYREEYYLSRKEPKPNTEAHMKWFEEMERAEGRAEIIIGKQRHGPIGNIPLLFEPMFTRFHEEMNNVDR